MDSCNVVNWIQKFVLHLTCHGQLKPLAVVIKCRSFTFVENTCDVAINAVQCVAFNPFYTVMYTNYYLNLVTWFTVFVKQLCRKKCDFY